MCQGWVSARAQHVGRTKMSLPRPSLDLSRCARGGFSDLIVPDLRGHPDWLPPTASLVFASSAGSPPSHSNFRNRVWLPALAVVGLERIHFHGLRDTGNQLIANAGAKRGTYRLGEGPSSPARP